MNSENRFFFPFVILTYVCNSYTCEWPVVYFRSNPAQYTNFTFSKYLDLLGDMNINVQYVNMDGTPTNRTLVEMMFTGPHSTSECMFHDVVFHQHTICYIQDTLHVFKKIRNSIESSRLESKTGTERYLVLKNRCCMGSLGGVF